MVFRYLRPRHPAHQLRDEMDRLLSGFFGSGSTRTSADQGRPAVNVWENGDALSVELEIPGVKSDDLDISVVDNELSVKVERPEVESEGVTYHRRERAAGSFARMLRLPAEVDPSRVSAELVNGVLTIHLPKAESARPRKIQVKTTP